jgi:alpha-beta hydrolase superfamily lysophospholipase
MSLKRHRAAIWEFVAPVPVAGNPYELGIETAAVIYNARTLFDGTEPLVVACHGHGGSGLNFGIPNYAFGHQIVELARAGFIVVSCDAGGSAGWASPIVDGIVTAVIGWAQTPRTSTLATGVGAKAGLVGAYGYSMGGGVVLGYAKNHPDKIGVCSVLNPAVSLDNLWSQYGTEIDILYTTARCTKQGGTTTINQTPATCQVDDASGMPASGYCYRVGTSDTKTLHYTSKDATHLYGVTIAAGSTTAGNGNIFTPSGAYTGHEGFNPTWDAGQGQYSAGNYAVPTILRHGGADTTVTPASIATFLAAANNPAITEELFAAATHTSVFRYTPADADVARFAAVLG